MIGGIAGVLIGLGAGAGVAAALGVNLVESVVRQRIVPIEARTEGAPGAQPSRETGVIGGPVSPSEIPSARSTPLSPSSEIPSARATPTPRPSGMPSSAPGADRGKSDQAPGRTGTHPTPSSSKGARHGDSSQAPGQTGEAPGRADQSPPSAQPGGKQGDGKKPAGTPSAAPSGKKTPAMPSENE